MKSEALYQELIALAEKLQIQVSEQNLRNTGIKVQSGLCKVKGQSVFIMDKHKPLRKKAKILARCLSRMEHEEIYVVPAVRELLSRYTEKQA
jgi:hypothetical protein